MTPTEIAALPEQALPLEYLCQTLWLADLEADLAAREERYGVGCRPDLTAWRDLYRERVAALEAEIDRRRTVVVPTCGVAGCDAEAAFHQPTGGWFCHACFLAQTPEEAR